MRNTVRSLPVVSILAGTRNLTLGEIQTLEEIRVQERLSLPTLCELTFAEMPGGFSGAIRLTPGTALSVWLEGQTVPLFIGQVTAVEYVYAPNNRREIRVRGYDLLHQLRKRHRVRAHVQVNLHDLAQELVADLALTVEAAQPGPVWPRLIQHRQSDFDLLRDLAEQCGLYLAVREGVLHLLTLQGLNLAPIPLTLGESLLEARLEINADQVFHSVQAVGWNPARVEVHEGRADSTQVGRIMVQPVEVGGSGRRELIDEGTLDHKHAASLAQAELDHCLAREATLWGVAEGNSRLQPGVPVEITGVAEKLTGRYILTSVTHVIDARQGFLSEISTLPPERKPHARHSITTPGIISQVHDPAHLGRVRAILPTYGHIETDWMEVLCLGAGASKGLVVLPDIGDHVLILLAHEDPGQGIVLGGLYSTHVPPGLKEIEELEELLENLEQEPGRILTVLEHELTPGADVPAPAEAGASAVPPLSQPADTRPAPDFGTSDETAGPDELALAQPARKQRYTLLTPGGERIHLDDRQKTIRLQHSDGSFIELSSHKMQLFATKELEIRAPGKRIRIIGEHIEFKRG